MKFEYVRAAHIQIVAANNGFYLQCEGEMMPEGNQRKIILVFNNKRDLIKWLEEFVEG